MNIKSNKLTLSPVMYPSFQKGSETDKDIIARACGFDSSMVILSLYCSFSYNNIDYELTIDFSTQGEQRLVNDIKDVENFSKEVKVSLNDMENILSNANKCKLNDQRDIDIFSHMCTRFDNLLRNNCWYEGDITFKKINSDGTKEKLIESYESDLGLEGCYESIKEIEDYFLNNEKLESYIEYLINY